MNTKLVKLFLIYTSIAFSCLEAITFTISADSTQTLNGDYYLTGHSSIFGAYSSIIFDNTSGGTRNVTLDGAGYTIWASTASLAQTLQKTGANNINLTIINCNLRNFDAVYTQSVNTGFVVMLGNSANIFYDNDYQMVNSSTLTVVGNATINLKGNTLTNPAGSGFVDITGATAKLNIKNGTFRSVATKFAGSTTYNGTLKFENVRIVIDAATNVELDYISNSNCANMEIAGRVTISGKLPTTIGSDLFFDFKSSGTCTVLTDSMLAVERGCQLRYQPYSPVGLNSGGNYNTFNSKRKLVLTDLSSKLFIDGSSLTTTNTGLALDRGNLIIDGRSTFTITTATAAQFDLGSAVVVDILPSATIKLNGPTNYNLTTA